MKKKAVISSVAIIVTVVCILLYLSRDNTPDNTPEQNRAIEIKALETKNPDLCNEIHGNSYYYGPRDEKISISEQVAREECRSDIQRGITPGWF